MTSKISFFSLMKEDFKQRIWMAALSMIGSAFSLPVFFLLAKQRYFGYVAQTPANAVSEHLSIFFRRFFTSEASVSQGIVLIIGAAIVAIGGFRYLYSRQMADTFHALPLSRNHLFLAGYLNGLLIWLIPFLLNMLCTLLLMWTSLPDSTYFGSILKGAITSTLLYTLIFLSIYHLVLLGVMLSGNLLSALLSTVILGTAIAGITSLLSYIMMSFMDSYIEPTNLISRLIWASPLFCGIKLLQGWGDSSGLTVLQSHSAQIVNLQEYWLLLAIQAVLAVFYLMAAWYYYQKRPSEAAGRGILNKPLGTIISFAGSILCGLGCTVLFQDFARLNLVVGWLIFSSAFGCIFTFGIFQVAFEKSLKAFFLQKIPMAAAVLCCVLMVLSIRFDWIGYETRIPDVNRILSASIKISNYQDSSYLLEQAENGTLIYQNDKKMSYQDPNVIHQLLTVVMDSQQQNRNAQESKPVLAYLKVSINLKGGGTYERLLRLYEADKEALRPIIESDSFLHTYYPLSSGQLTLPEELQIRDVNKEVTYTLSDKESISRIMTSYTNDFTAHSSMEELNKGIVVSQMQALLRLKDSFQYYTLNVYDSYVNTIDELKNQNPSMVTTLDDLPVASVTLSATLDGGMTKEALYSLFQLEGYPNYQDLVEENQANKDASVSVKDTLKEKATTHISTNTQDYAVTITDTQELSQLLPLLKIGEDSGYAPLSPTAYLVAGTVTDASGNKYSCYVEAGKLDQNWIDAMRKVT